MTSKIKKAEWVVGDYAAAGLGVAAMASPLLVAGRYSALQKYLKKTIRMTSHNLSGLGDEGNSLKKMISGVENRRATMHTAAEGAAMKSMGLSPTTKTIIDPNSRLVHHGLGRERERKLYDKTKGILDNNPESRNAGEVGNYLQGRLDVNQIRQDDATSLIGKSTKRLDDSDASLEMDLIKTTGGLTGAAALTNILFGSSDEKKTAERSQGDNDRYRDDRTFTDRALSMIIPIGALVGGVAFRKWYAKQEPARLQKLMGLAEDVGTADRNFRKGTGKLDGFSKTRASITKKLDPENLTLNRGVYTDALKANESRIDSQISKNEALGSKFTTAKKNLGTQAITNKITDVASYAPGTFGGIMAASSGYGALTDRR